MPGPFFDPFHGNGVIVERHPNKVIWQTVMDDQIIHCTQTRVDLILDENQEALNNSAGQRWGDGKVVASIPLPLFFEKIVPMRQAGDEDAIKRFLNDIDYRKLRKFGGKI